MARACDSDMARIYRQISTLGRLVDEGKRDPDWVSRVLQDAIEHREDGRLDFVKDSKVVELGVVEVDYETPLAVLTEGIETIDTRLETFELLPKPMFYRGGSLSVELVLRNYEFNQFRNQLDPTYDDIRRLMDEDHLVPVNIRELIACWKQKQEALDQNGINSLIPLGIGIPCAGMTGEVRYISENVAQLRRSISDEPFKLTTNLVTMWPADKKNWYLARKR